MFALRKIRKGKVKIFGSWYAPDERFMKYDGRLDGLVYAFGVYKTYTSQKYESFVSLWGSKEAFYNHTDWPGKECVNGAFVWNWWNKVS